MAVMPSDVERMTDTLFITGPLRSRKSSKFWILLTLAAVIATAGVLADSTATVIGAMIVAPLMTPILGTALAVVLAERSPMIRSMLLVLGGALAVIAIGYLMGRLGAPADSFAANGQIEARINPKLIDLTAALATGLVGAFALIRSDISDTLPGVAIAISLVPPLAVVGLLLAVERYSDAAGAALLFGTNVAAIIATGMVVFLGYRIRDAARQGGLPVGHFRGASVAVICVILLIIGIPLGIGSWTVAQDQITARRARPIADAWAAQNNWLVSSMSVDSGRISVTALGSPPDADPVELRADLNNAGLDYADLVVRLVLGGSATCPAMGDTCVRSSTGSS
jgi:uncharacterized hydrophobic protein (TIGR00271 family)